MNLIGNRIYHIKLGFGEIIGQSKDKIQVRFDLTPNEEVYLFFPNKNFRTYFKFVNEYFHYKIHQEILDEEEFSVFASWWNKNIIPEEVFCKSHSDNLRTSAVRYIVKKTIRKKNRDVYDKEYVKILLSSNELFRNGIVKTGKLDLDFFEELHRFLFVCSKKIFILDKQKLCITKYIQPKDICLGQLPVVPKQFKINSEKVDQEKLLLYVYKNLGSIKCSNSKNHLSESVTITTINTKGDVISFNAFQCQNCKKIYSDLETVNRIFKDCKYPLIKIVLDSEAEINLRDKSELSMYGYNARKNVLTEQQRQELIATLLINRILTKEKIITMLQWLMNLNGKNPNCNEALKKWKSDYEFVVNFNLYEQRKIISKNVEIIK